MTGAVPLAHADRDHALLSASGAKIWFNCPPAARLQEQYPDSGSEYAREGSLAHEIAELKLRKQFTDPMGPKVFKAKLKELQRHELYSPEMESHTDAYLDHIKGIVHGYPAAPYVAIEQRLDYSVYAPEGFGTGDLIVIGGNVLNVVDFKYGKGVPVTAEDNLQMVLYGLGAWLRYSILYDIRRVRMGVFQPRLDSISTWDIPIERLLELGETIKPIAQLAWQGYGDYKAGEHCGFCRAKYQCRARSTQLSTVADDFGGPVLPPLMSDLDVGKALAKAQDLAKWAKDLEDYALKSLLEGKEIPGWKAVEGRKTRAFINIDAAFAKLEESGYDKALLWERKPITLTKVEELVQGKKKFTELLSEFVTIAPGKPTLAPETDKRDPINRASINRDFGGTENE
jgi:hypothetical protein